MNGFSIFAPLYHCFSSKTLYRDVAANWRGRAFVYLLILLALTWLPQMFGMYSSINAFLSDDGGEFLAQVPPITIEDGVLSIDAEEPYVIRGGSDGGSNDATDIVIIDTTGAITSLEGQDAGVLVTGSDVTIRRGPGQVQTFSLSDVAEVSIDGETLERLATSAGPWIPIISYPFVLVWSYAYRLLQVLIYSLFAVLIARQQGLSLEFPALYSITLVAITPSVYLKTVVGLSGFDMPLLFVPHIALALGYVYFAVLANKTGDAQSAELKGSAGA